MLTAAILRHTAVIALALSVTAAAQAASLSVSPIVVDLAQDRQTAAITLKNEGNESRVVQTELLRWTQRDGENIYAPSRDLLANPPMATLQPGQTQVIRVGMNREADAAQELAYRLYISEVPPPPREGFTGLRIALRLGLAVFVSPTAKPAGRLDWRATRNLQGAVRLTMRNGGNRHVRLTGLKVRDAGSGQHLAELRESQFTLLAGQSRPVPVALPAAWQGRQLNLLASTEEGDFESRIDVERAPR